MDLSQLEAWSAADWLCAAMYVCQPCATLYLDAADDGQHMQASPGQGEYSTVAGIDNSGRSLPGGFSNKPLSASQLAAIQAKDAKVAQTASNAATVETPSGSTSDGASQQVRIPQNTCSRSVCRCADRVMSLHMSLDIKQQLLTFGFPASCGDAWKLLLSPAPSQMTSPTLRGYKVQVLHDVGPHCYGHGWGLRIGRLCAGCSTPHRHDKEDGGSGERSCAYISGLQGTAS